MKRIITIALCVFASILAMGCGEKGSSEEPSAFNVSVYLPSAITIEDGGVYTFSVLGNEAAADGDVMKMANASKEYSLPVENIKPKSFDVTFPKGFIQGKYSASLVRGKDEIQLGSVQVNVTYNGADADIDPSTTVYGWVKCDGEPIAGAVISDGYEVVATGKDGFYQMASQKKNLYVFISVPSGYTVLSDGVLPSFYVYLIKASDTPERADFQLIRQEGQKNHKMLLFGDIHLANRNNDRKQFADFVADVNSYLSTATGPVYAMTLGDMAWDQYWYTNGYEFEQYLRDVNGIKGLQIFHTIGNHDHDMNAVGDWDTAMKYKKEVCPTYYSFNIGDIHYISVDNILCRNSQASTTNPDYRAYWEDVAPEVIDWLKKDLEYVDKSTRIVAASHAAIFRQDGSNSLRNADEYISCFAGYKVDFVTGHTHKLWNVDKMSSRNMFEHNSGAVCATWWWTGYYTSGLNLAQDGTPGGWRVMDVSGDDISWQFKGTGKSLDYQFRTYDRNEIDITAAEYAPSANEANAQAFTELVRKQGWAGASKDNYVYINVWDYDPAWTITVTEKETGKTLGVENVKCCDPLYLVAYSAKRYNVNKTPTFAPFVTNHLFRVQASSANSTLVITVKDRFGRNYTETMTRPKPFSVGNYANE